jgi:peptidyl-prolyl cis-trans isomerase D
MAVIGSLRKRSGLIATLVGISLMAFVLTGLFESGFQIFGESNVVGVISGEDISYEQFMIEYQKMEEMQKSRNNLSSLDDQMADMVNNSTWEYFLRTLAFEKEYATAGIRVTEKELADIFIGNPPDQMIVPAFTDQQTGQVNPDFADANGRLDGRKIKAYIDKISTDPQSAQYYEQWKEFERSVKDNKFQLKYYTLLKKGLRTPTPLAKQDYQNANTSLKFRFVLKRYNMIPDSAVKVDESELKKYYNKNKYKFKQEESRKVDFVVFDVFPSEEDRAAALADIQKIAEEFSKTKRDSEYVVQESETGYFDNNYLKAPQVAPYLQNDSAFLTSGKGTVTAPYQEGLKWKVSKLVDVKMLPDSASVRHILINYQGATGAQPTQTRSKEAAKSMADSLTKILKGSNKLFPDFVVKFSSDSGSVREDKEGKRVLKKRDEIGAYKWFKEGMMVPEFQKAAFEGKKGDITVVETIYGFHIVEVLDRGKESPRYQIATIEKTVEPSSKTRQEVYNQALDFVSTYGSDADAFQKGVKEAGLNLRTAETLKSSDVTLPGLEKAKDIVRWAYTNPKGSVSKEPFSYKNKYVVASLTEVREKGFATLEQKKAEIEAGAIKEKKAAMFKEEFSKALSGASNIETLASKMNLNADSVPSVRFNDFSVTMIGRELGVIGTLFALEPGKLSAPVTGEQGVYVLVVDKVTPAPEPKDYIQQKMRLTQTYQGKIDQQLYNVLKEKAEIKDNRFKFF